MTGVVFLDLEKAFDTVNHNIFLNKLNNFNVSDNSIDWFKDYLTDRELAVTSMGVVSLYLTIACGAVCAGKIASRSNV